MTQMECAINLAKKGFHVFPLRPKSKLPLIEDFSHEATTDIKKIKRWWMDPVLGIEQPFNVGISTDKFKDNKALVVIDVDNKNGKHGDEELLKLELSGSVIPPTMEQITPTGGRHLIYEADSPLKQGSNTLGEGLDIRSKGGYIVAAGSVLDNGEYTLVERELAHSPDWLVETLGRAREKQIKGLSPSLNIDETQARERAIHYLENEAKISVEGQGGDQVCFQVAARVKDLGVSQETCYTLLLEHWNEMCIPPWSPEELRSKVQNAYRYGENPIGAASPEAEFTKFKTEEELSYLERINKEYAIVYLESSHAILHETIDEKGRPKRNLLQEATFRRKFSTKTIQKNKKGKAITWAEEWLDWEGRREYAGLCFTPERKPKHNYYNLWRGFTVEALDPIYASDEQRRGLEMFLQHAKNNVCAGEENHFAWLMGYFAHLIQKPYERPLTTLVFKGRKGTGKNALIDRVGRLLGPTHYLVAHDGRYLTSNFNGHMDSCLMLVLDEAFWSGDKTAEGKLKGITTAPEIMIERKGKEPYMVDNLVRLIVIGNEEWLVPATQDERRYAVFQLGEERMQDRNFFGTMRVLLDEKGGSRLLLHYFKNFDLSQVDVNDAPKTQALLEQKQKTASALEQWWFESLEEGVLLNADFEEGWPDRIPKDAFQRAFTAYCHSRNIKPKFADSLRALGHKMKFICPSIDGSQKTRGTQRVNAYILPTLAQARKDYETYIGHEVNWND